MHSLLKKIQQNLNKDEIYLINNLNEFLSHIEYPKIQELTGFSGSNSSLLISDSKIILITDNRYTTQAKKELPSFIDIEMNFKNNILNNKNIICNTKCFPIQTLKQFETTNTIQHKDICHYSSKGKIFKHINTNFKFFDELSKNHTMHYPYSDSISSKIQLIKNKNPNVSKYIIANNEEASWLLNIRGGLNKNNMASDIYVIIEDIKHHESKTTNTNKIILYSDANIDIENISRQPMQQFYTELELVKSNVMLSSSNYYIYNKLKKYIINYNKMLADFSLIKRVKSKIEIDQIKKIHILDSTILIHFLAWVSNNYQGKTELDLYEQLKTMRSENEMYICESFDAIIGNNMNGAIMHYNTLKNSVKLQDGILLIDSGGHYYGATTDVTRSIYLTPKKQKSPPQELERYIYTSVLKAHLSIYETIIPSDNSPMSDIGAIIRNKILEQNFTENKKKYLKNFTMDYAHGTGHGIGNCLNVHEYKYNTLKSNIATMANNLVFSNEPGLYLEDKFGIRIENATLSKEYSEDKAYTTFENLTLVPFSKDLTDTSLLSPNEKKIIKNYYAIIKDKILTNITCPTTLEWLQNELDIDLN